MRACVHGTYSMLCVCIHGCVSIQVQHYEPIEGTLAERRLPCVYTEELRDNDLPGQCIDVPLYSCTLC